MGKPEAESFLQTLTIARPRTFRCQRGHEISSTAIMLFNGKHVICFDCLAAEYGMEEVKATGDT